MKKIFWLNLFKVDDSDTLVYDANCLLDTRSFMDKFLDRMRVRLDMDLVSGDEEVIGRIFKVVDLVGQGGKGG
jgi:hypothetical protein